MEFPSRRSMSIMDWLSSRERSMIFIVSLFILLPYKGTLGFSLHQDTWKAPSPLHRHQHSPRPRYTTGLPPGLQSQRSTAWGIWLSRSSSSRDEEQPEVGDGPVSEADRSWGSPPGGPSSRRRQFLKTSTSTAITSSLMMLQAWSTAAPGPVGVTAALAAPASEVTMEQAATILTETSPASSGSSQEANFFRPAKRPTAYRVDSTIPPTLIPISQATKQKKVLAALGQGGGTDKNLVLAEDSLTLNNILNKAVFGSINSVASLLPNTQTRTGPAPASFVCLGLPQQTALVDVQLAVSVLTTMLTSRSAQRPTALALAWCPLSAQPLLDAYNQGQITDAILVDSLIQLGTIDPSTVALYLPLLQLAREKSLDLLALAPESIDLDMAATEGLQNVDLERRSLYVVDVDGFISFPRDPKFKLYLDRSLIKDYKNNPTTDPRRTLGNFVAQRMLAHEAAATAVARYAMARPGSLVVVVAPTPDLRFLGGINGRLPRTCRFFQTISSSTTSGSSSNNKNSRPPSVVTDNEVTTILLNPTAAETLSKTRHLRLEIGTGPDTLDYQTKVADYLWFSSMPKVNLIPRLMNE